MIAHRCFLDDAPNGFLPCLCLHGIDHEEDMFDIPLTEEERSVDPGSMEPRLVTTDQGTEILRVPLRDEFEEEMDPELAPLISAMEQLYAFQVEEYLRNVTRWIRIAKVRPSLAADKPMLDGFAQCYVQDFLDAHEDMVLVVGSLTWELHPAPLPYGPPAANYPPSWEELHVTWKAEPA